MRSFPEDESVERIIQFSIAPQCSAVATRLRRRSCPPMRAGRFRAMCSNWWSIDYHAMQNSQSAMGLRDRVMPPELKQLEEALQKTALNGAIDDRRSIGLCSVPALRRRAIRF